MMIVVISHAPEKQSEKIAVNRIVGKIKVTIAFARVAKQVNAELLVQSNDLSNNQSKKNIWANGVGHEPSGYDDKKIGEVKKSLTFFSK